MKYKKTILIAAAIVCAIPLVLTLGLLYGFHHPSTFIDLIEDTLHEHTGLSVSIEKLTWSDQPLQLVAENVHVAPTKQERDFEAHIVRFKVISRISGPFAHRTLKIETIQLNNFSVQLTSRFKFETPDDTPDSPGLMIQVLRWLLRVFIFEKVQIEQIDLSNGNVRIQAGQSTVHLNHIEGSTDRLKAVTINGTADINGLPAESTAQVFDWKLNIQLADLNTVSGRIFIPMINIQTPVGTAERVAIEARLKYDRRHQRIDVPAIRLKSPQMLINKTPEESMPLGPIVLDAAGNYDLVQNHLRLHRWELDFQKILHGSGQADMQFSSGWPIQIHLAECQLESEELQLLLANSFNLNPPFSLSGPLGVTGRIQKPTGADPAVWEFGLALALNDNRFDFAQADTTLQGLLSGNIQIDGPLDKPRLKAQLTSRQTVSAGRWWKTDPFETGFSLAISHPRLAVKRLEADLPELLLLTAAGPISLRKVKLRLTGGDYNIKSGSFFCPDVQIDSDLLKNLDISLSGSRKAGRIMLESANSGLLNAARSLDALPSGWLFGAEDSLSTTLVWDGSERIRINGTGRLSDLQFTNADDSCLGENLSLTATVKTILNLTEDSLSADIDTTMDQGEVLCGKYYLDLEPNRIRTEGHGVFIVDRQTFQISKFRFEIEKLFRLHMNGMLKAAGAETKLNLAVRLMPTDLQTLFNQLLLEPYQYEMPTLSDLKLDGTVQADLNLRWQANRWAVKGHTEWLNGHLSMPSRGLELKAINLRLPVWYHAGLILPQRDPIAGRLSVNHMRVPLIPPQPVELTLKAAPNRIRIEKETRLQVGSGTIIIGPVDLHTPYRQAPELMTNLTLVDIPAAALLKDLWNDAPDGIIRGQLHKISLIDRNLIGEGMLEANLFSGLVQITDPGLDEWLSSASALRLHVDLDRLNLAELTGGTPFGKIEGILSGHIHELEFVHGEPQHFNLRLETVKTKRIPQRINVRAVENIARLGGGQSPFIGFAGTFAAMFKAFPYKKIGMAAFLNNDVFKINGTIEENGIEYLVRRSGLSGVDVVNLNRDNRISFKDMIKRIQRIKGSNSRPVIR